MRSISACLLALTATLAAPALMAAEAKPAPLVMIVPFTQNGPTDNVARPVAEAMGRVLGRNVVIKNIVGGGGTVGARQAARARADGDTLMLTNLSQAAAPALYAQPGYDPVKDFEPIGLVADVPMVLLGKSGLKADSFDGLRQYLDKGSRKLVLGNAGKGSASHLCGLLLSHSLIKEFDQRAYPGTEQAVADLVTEGNIDLLCDQVSNVLVPVKAKSVKVYGVTAAARLDVLPDVRTLAEQGLKGFELLAWHGLYAPKGTPQATLDRLGDALRTALQDPKLKKDLLAIGARVAESDKATAKALRTRLESDVSRWQEVVRAERAPPR